MPEQLNLFAGTGAPEEGPTEGDGAGPAVDAGALDELFHRSERWRSGEGLRRLLEFIARFPGYSPLNALLLFVQQPEATHVATARGWARLHRRRLSPQARPLVILAPMSPVLFVYDLADTQGPPLPEAVLTPPAPAERQVLKTYETTLHNCGVERIAVRETPEPPPAGEAAAPVTPALRRSWAHLHLDAGARYLILLDAGLGCAEKYASLVSALAHLFCGHLGIDGEAWWMDRKGLDLPRADLEADAAAFLVCRRMGLKGLAQPFQPQCPPDGAPIPPLGLSAVFQAVGHIEDMGRAPWRKPRRRSRY
jgi:hypothetical protein